MPSLSTVNPQATLGLLNCVGASINSGSGSLNDRCGIPTDPVTGAIRYPQTAQAWDSVVSCYCKWQNIQSMPMVFNQCAGQVAVKNHLLGDDAFKAADIFSFSFSAVCNGIASKSCKPTTIHAGVQTLPSIASVVASLKNDSAKVAAACTNV
ncbi:UNVERIFIED_CONTAM: hypothetical protein HDU68_010234 [Siphonaria sp. JEL0065]|nr:hypothetical protein HDU68_010234 [Siphonaria sp. JEL0065]